MHACRKFLDKYIGSIVGFLLVLGVGLLLSYTQFGWRLLHRSYDYPYALIPFEKPHEVILVYIDDASYTELKQSHITIWNRRLHAQLIDRLKAEGARAVVFDVVFSDPGPNPEDDKELARAIKEMGKVVLAADATPKESANISKGSEITPPYELFMDGAADIGKAELLMDEDLIARRIIPATTEELVLPLSWAGAIAAKSSLTNELSKFTKVRWTHYYGPPLTLPHVSYYQAIDPNSKEAPSGIFKDKIVLVGSRLLTKFAKDRKDEYRSPYSYWLKDKNLFMPGVEIQATFMLNLIRGDWWQRFSSSQELFITLCIALFLGGGLPRLRPLISILITVVIVFIIGLFAWYLACYRGIWFAWVILEVQLGVACAWAIIYKSMSLYVQKRLMQQSLSMYVSPAQVNHIINLPDILKPGAIKQEVSILFSDIAGFTSISEGMDSDKLAWLMNQYFEVAVTQCIHATHGTVVKFIGDAIFAMWNAPEIQADHVARACSAGIRLRDKAGRFKGIEDLPPLNTRIGLHTGLANVGNFGSSTRIDYTAIGENINLASRMEGLNKYLGTMVLITGDVEAGVRGQFLTRYMGRFILKGFANAVNVYELIAEGRELAPPPWHDTFNQAVKYYINKEVDRAYAVFQQISISQPEDGPTLFYLKMIQEMRESGIDSHWTGDVVLHDK